MNICKQSERRSNQELDRQHDYRDPYEKDLARLIHSAAFRRLQAKTQVLGIGEGDFHRTRLTHSMEVAQIGRGIVRNLKHTEICKSLKEALPNEDLIFAIGLAHDLGHPPFGHGGEIALNYCMREHGGFEGNGQTLRILSKLESHTEQYGLDMTRRALLGILKYPVSYSKLHKGKKPASKDLSQLKAKEWKPPKCFHDDEQDVVDWILSPLSHSDREAFTKYSEVKDDEHGKPYEKLLDTSIMDLADDIAYGVHDLEDAIALKLVNREMWSSISEKFPKQWMKCNDLADCEEQLFGCSSDKRKCAIGALVNAFIVNTKISEILKFESDLLKYRANLSDDARAALNLLLHIVEEYVIKIPEVQTLEYRGQQIVGKIFDAIASDPKRLLKKSFGDKWNSLDNESGKMRVICDYVSGMTDEYATRMYERLFMPRQGTIFQRL